MDPKHYIKQNKQQVKKTESTFKTNMSQRQSALQKKQQFETKNVGKIPKYLQKYREEEELERQQTRIEIEMNKRPSGTRVVSKQEQEQVLSELYGQKKYLQEGIENMSVTLFTNRAQNLHNGYVRNLEEIDRTLNTFGRKKVYVAEKNNA